ncbi:hypothetical protein BDN72DRAFT_770852 [Pluteus cervinus]|uniref:Uncharacterized protein n=1 Tax=Pluteus cervinus TaxID=181527 RepID=A0ACD3AN09_9AGAR|nr:hypothetical protein BDN72DRAFT_770852 [Pluteus cervinus]
MSSNEDSDSSASDVPGPNVTTQNSKSKPQKIRRGEESNDSLSDSEDAPALSHAERRRQRKRQLKAQDQQEGGGKPSIKKRKLEDGTALSKRDPTTDQVPGGRQHSVWVGNMSFKTTTDDLKRFFADVGGITRINMPMKFVAPQEKGAWAGAGKKGENRGFAYVDYSTAEQKQAAIAKSEQPLLGRKLLIKDGRDDFTGRPAASQVEPEGATGSQSHSKTAQKILKVQKQPAAPTLFLGNLGFETTVDDIRQLFEAHRANKGKRTGAVESEETNPTKTEGKEKQKEDLWIRKIRMGTFEDSGLCKGFAFADFVSIEEATNVLLNPRNHLLNGRKLVVEYASPDAVRRGAFKPKPSGDSRATPDHSTRGGKSKKFLSERTKVDTGRMEFDPQVVDRNRGERDTDTAKVQSRNAAKGGKGYARPDDGRRRTDSKQTRQRPRPGAALALAKRESAAIVPSQGQKITF